MYKTLLSSVRRLRYGAFVFVCLSHAAAYAADLPAPVADALKRAKIPESALALHVQDVTQSAPVLALNEQRAMTSLRVAANDFPGSLVCVGLTVPLKPEIESDVGGVTFIDR